MTNGLHRQRFTINVPTYRRRSEDPGDRTMVRTGFRAVEVEADLGGLGADLGPRAVRSKKGRATVGAGRIVVRVVKEGS